jgi:hypothetical protein
VESNARFSGFRFQSAAERHTLLIENSARCFSFSEEGFVHWEGPDAWERTASLVERLFPGYPPSVAPLATGVHEHLKDDLILS